MAILKVAQLGHPVLRRVAEPVDPARITTPAFQRFVDDLFETMDAYDGAGLAAPQVHVSERVVVLTLEGGREPEVWINPELSPLDGPTTRTVEGCLSVEGLRGVVERPARLKVTFLDRSGVRRAYALAGFPAIVAQHECDHLDGVLYTDKVDPISLAFTDELMRHGLLVRLDDDDLDDDVVVLQPEAA